MNMLNMQVNQVGIHAKESSYEKSRRISQIIKKLTEKRVTLIKPFKGTFLKNIIIRELFQVKSNLIRQHFINDPDEFARAMARCIVMSFSL